MIDRGSGAALLREREKKLEARRIRFVQNLDMVQGLCMICLAAGDMQGKAHSLDRCLSWRKQKFFKAKKQANSGKAKWMAAYSGCFRCGLSQGLCEQQGKAGCRYKDIVMPLSWSGLLVKRWEDHIHKIAGRKFEGDDGEEQYMKWLGWRVTVLGEDGNNMVLVCEDMLDKIVGELLVNE